MSLIIHPEDLAIVQGELASFTLPTASGRQKVGAFCSGCGVRIYNQTDALMAVKAGTLDNTSMLTPNAHYWVKRKQAWLALADGLPQRDTA